MFYFVLFIIIIFVLISFFKSEDKVQGDKVVKESISISFINRLGIFIGVVGAIIKVIASIFLKSLSNLFSMINIYGTILLFVCLGCFLFSFLRWLFVKLFL